jgi:hypothetical protein
MQNKPTTSAVPPPTPAPDVAGVLSQLHSLRELVAFLSSRTTTLEQTLSVVTKDIADTRVLYPEVTGRNSPIIKSILDQLAALNARADSLQMQITTVANTHLLEISKLNAKFSTIEHLLATDPYKITKAKLIRLAKELNL